MNPYKRSVLVHVSYMELGIIVLCVIVISRFTIETRRVLYDFSLLKSKKNEDDFISINRRETRPGDLPSTELHGLCKVRIASVKYECESNGEWPSERR